jgi:O-antigen/teichoic acid export membrane protein
LQEHGMTDRRPGERSLSWNVGFTVVGTASYLAAQYLQLMAVAKLGDSAMVADYSLAVAIVLPLIALSQMQLRQLCVTDVHRAYSFAEYLTHRGLASLLALGLSLVVSFVIRATPSFSLLLLMLTAQRVTESLSDVAYAQWQRHERQEVIAISQTSRSLMGLLVFGVVLWSGGALITAIGSMLIIGLIALLMWDLPGAWRLSASEVHAGRIHSAELWKLNLLAAPLGLITAIQVGASYLPRYLLEGTIGSTEMAFYAIAATPLSLMALFVGAVSQSALARIAVSLQTGDFAGFQRLTWRMTGLYAVINGLGTISLFLAGPWILQTMFTAEYRQAAPAAQILALGVFLGSFSNFGSSVIVATRSNWLQFGNTITGIVVQVLGCLWLAPQYGFLGAAWAEFARYLACTLFLAVTGTLVFRERKRNYPAAVSTTPAMSRAA